MSATQKVAVSLIDSDLVMQEAMQIRHKVFVEEQKVPAEIEYDEFEGTSTHIIARIGSKAVGTARWRQTDKGFKLERFAVSRSARGEGVGAALVAFVLDNIDDRGKAYLNSQVSAIGFYAKLGFRAEGEIFYEADIPHRKMIYGV